MYKQKKKREQEQFNLLVFWKQEKKKTLLILPPENEKKTRNKVRGKEGCSYCTDVECSEVFFFWKECYADKVYKY